MAVKGDTTVDTVAGALRVMEVECHKEVKKRKNY